MSALLVEVGDRDDLDNWGAYPRERAMLDGLVCSIAVALSLLIAAAGGDEIIVETSNATIESRQGQRLRVVFAAEDRPALIFKPVAGDSSDGSTG